jgi:hypothetical protein
MVLIVSECLGITPLNWDLCATADGETYTPFALYVRPATACLPHAIFTPFTRLPLELQLRILAFCDSASLFQLMHVSHVLRGEARKLSWSAPDAWYRVDARFLLSGGLSGGQDYATNFFASIAQLEVDFPQMSDLGAIWDDGVYRDSIFYEPSWSPERQIRDFWEVLQRTFPCAIRVTISESKLQWLGHPPPSELETMVQLCPPRICVLVSVLQYEDEASRRAIRYLARRSHSDDCSTADAWDIIHTRWARQSILPPPKVWKGPVGAFRRIEHARRRYNAMKMGTIILLITAIGRRQPQALDRPIVCPAPACDVYFTVPVEWATHAVESCHYRTAVPPEEHQELFDQQEKRLEALFRQECLLPTERLRRSCGGPGSRERLDNELAFLSQLEQDPEYAHSKPAYTCSTWISYFEEIYGERLP